jgi:hypothetical protein
MKETTITEALAERKVIATRIARKREAVRNYMVIAGNAKDPIKDEGGSVEFIKRELQAIEDLEQAHVRILRAIQRVNGETIIEIEGTARTVAEWLIWRRDVAPGEKEFLANLVQGIQRTREAAQRRSGTLVDASTAANAKDVDVVVNYSESQLMARVEGLETLLGRLDGQLSLKNATVIVSY